MKKMNSVVQLPAKVGQENKVYQKWRTEGKQPPTVLETRRIFETPHNTKRIVCKDGHLDLSQYKNLTNFMSALRTSVRRKREVVELELSK